MIVLDMSKFILISKNIVNYKQLQESVKCSYYITHRFENTLQINKFFSKYAFAQLTHFAFIFNNNIWKLFFPTDQCGFDYLFNYFINKLIELNRFIIIDIITSNINIQYQEKRLLVLKKIYKVNIRYSLNTIGYYNLYNNWILDSDNVDIKDIYFNDNINNWNDIL